LPLQVASLFRQACQSVEHLHALSPPMIHRDIKLENYLLTREGALKLCDFGSATLETVNPANMPFDRLRVAEHEIERNTTPQNRAPEMLDLHKGQVVDGKADVWALGCMLFALCFRVRLSWNKIC
jgi:serine/threonine protein kinase